MITYTRTNINVISLLCTCAIMLVISILPTDVHNVQEKQPNNIEMKVEEKTQDKQNTQKKNNTIKQVTIKQETNEKVNVQKLQEKDTTSWEIQIPAIGLSAPIQQGTSAQIMNKYVGHFEQTSFFNGNVGLAAHNRGYPVNYFAHLKDLKYGDEIIYIKDGMMKKYKVVVITVITDEDWSYLQPTKDNRITLITCVENQPSYRRCIQAIEK